MLYICVINHIKAGTHTFFFTMNYTDFTSSSGTVISGRSLNCHAVPHDSDTFSLVPVDDFPIVEMPVSTASAGVHRFPAIRIGAKAMSHTATSLEFELRHPFTAGRGSLSADDLRRFSDTVRKSVFLDCEAARMSDGGTFLPSLVWHTWHSADRRIHRSVPVIVAGAEGNPFTRPMRFDYVKDSSGRVTALRAAGTLIPRFSISAEADFGVDCDQEEIARLRLEFHAVSLLTDTGGLLSVAAGADYLTARWPSEAAGQLLRRLLPVLDCVDTTDTVILSPAPPAGASVATWPVTPAPESRAAVDKAVGSSAPKAADPLEAGVTLRSGDVTIGTDVALSYPDAPAAEWIALHPGIATGPWDGVVKVAFAHSATEVEPIVSAMFSASRGMPERISPLIAVPSSRAARLDIQITDSVGVRRFHSFPLTPVQGWAFYVASDMKGIDVASGMIQADPMLPERITPKVPQTGMVTVAHATESERILASAQISSTQVVALTPAIRSSSAWDFGRAHFYAFSPDGIMALAVNTARSRISASVIDTAPVVSAAHVARGRNAVYAFSQGSILAVSGAKAAMFDRVADVKALGFEAATSRLWALLDSGEIRVYHENGRYHSRSFPAIAGFAAVNGRLYGLKPSESDSAPVRQAYDLSDPHPLSEMIQVQWECRLRLDKSRRTLRGIKWPISGSSLRLTLQAGADNGSGHPHRITSFAISGEVLAPVIMPLVPVPCEYLTLSVSGMASPDMEFSLPVLF